MNIYKKTLDEMPDYFSSNKFAERCSANGLSDIDRKNGKTGRFLLKHCTQSLGSQRMWYKKPYNSETNTQIKTNELSHETLTSLEKKRELTDEELIALAKSRGFKLMKRVEQWVDL